MWNDQHAPPGYPPSQSPVGGYDDPSADPESPHRSPEQLTRLEGEWRRLQRSFAYHPHITVHPLRGDPPGEYQIDYRLTTLVIGDAGQLQYAPGASVHVWLPPEFPAHPPLVRPLVGLFHPNVAWEGFHLESAWQPNDTLVGLVRRIGDLLTYRIFDPDSVVNAAAMDWLNANAQSLPLDGQANFAPTAGGEPLGKIVRYGSQTIDSIRQSLQSMQSQLLGRSAPDAAAVREFALRTGLALDLFLDGDVPDDLRSAASALHDCARELPAATRSYDALRGRRAGLESLRAAIKAALDARSVLSAEMKKLAGLVELPEGMDPEGIHDPAMVEDPALALRLIPEPATLQPFQLRLPKLIGDANKRIEAVRAGLRGAEGPPAPQSLPSETLLGQKLEQELAAAAADSDKARAEAADALAAAEPVLKRAREDAASLEQAARYREYVDLLSRGRDLERRLADWGGEGVQAYYIRSGEERFGPFQFEQPVDLGGASVLGRNTARGAIEVFDAASETSLGQGAENKVTVLIGGGAPEEGDGREESNASHSRDEGDGEPAAPAGHPMTFELTERCDDLLVQLDFLRRQTQEGVEKPDPAAGVSPSWCGAVCRLLTGEVARGKVRKDLSKVSQRWRATMLDLAALGPLKERLATYNLLERAYEKAPPLKQAIKESRAAVKESDKRLAEIFRHCSRDVENDRLIVPPKYDRPYQAELKLRKEAGEREVKSATLLKALVIRLTKRLRTPKLLGRAGTPSLRVMKPLPPGIESLPLTDDDLGDRIGELESLLKTPLGGPRANPNRVRPAEVTAEPAGVTAEPAADAAAEPVDAVLGEVAGEGEGAGQEMAAGELRTEEEPAGTDEAGGVGAGQNAEAAEPGAGPAEQQFVHTEEAEGEHAGHAEHVREHEEREADDDFVSF